MVVKDVKTKVLEAKKSLGQIQNLTVVHNMTTRRPQTISLSCIVGEFPNVDDVGCLRPCTLCGRGFPHRDIVMALCGCHYHPWCIVSHWSDVELRPML